MPRPPQRPMMQLIFICDICGVYPANHRHSMCRQCARSYDRDLRKDTTVHAAIHWAARRARWGMRLKKRRG